MVKQQDYNMKDILKKLKSIKKMRRNKRVFSCFGLIISMVCTYILIQEFMDHKKYIDE